MTKILCSLILTLGLVLAVTLFAAASPEEMPGAVSDQVVKVEGFKDVYKTGNVYLAGQPNLDTLRWMKSNGVTLVVNLRTETENKEFTAAAFSEESMVKELGMTYSLIPIGDKESYSPRSVEKLAEALQSAGGTTLIHCLSAGRATYLWMAYLVRHQGKTLNEAAAIGRQMRFALPVEDFLGAKISFSLEEVKK